MTKLEFDKMVDGRIARMTRELASNLADLVESGDLTEEEANKWLSEIFDRWNRGDSF